MRKFNENKTNDISSLMAKYEFIHDNDKSSANQIRYTRGNKTVLVLMNATGKIVGYQYQRKSPNVGRLLDNDYFSNISDLESHLAKLKLI